MQPPSIPAQIVEAIKSEDRDSLRRLLLANPEHLAWNTPFGGETWVGYAASKGKLRALKLLIEMGADLNLGDHREGVRPICSAAANGQLAAAELLIQNGAVLDSDASVRNPLFSAIVGRSSAIVELLLKAGADASVRYNTRSMNDMDAVAFAMLRGEESCARVIADWIAEGDEREITRLIAQADQIANTNVGGGRRNPGSGV